MADPTLADPTYKGKSDPNYPISQAICGDNQAERPILTVVKLTAICVEAPIYSMWDLPKLLLVAQRGETPVQS